MSIDAFHASSFGEYRAIGSLVAMQTEAFPKHARFLRRRFAAADAAELRLCDELAKQIHQLAGETIEEFIRGYDFICDIQKREEIYFRRNDRYRLTRAAEAFDEVYSNRAYMQSYMRGLLMTQVFWSNHTASIRFFTDEMLRRNPVNYRLLEIGPGHGLLFSRAALDPRAGSVVGWDLSPASVAESNESLRRLGIKRPFKLETRDLFDSAAQGPEFDAVVFSEVLEHLEQPRRALEAIRGLTRPKGRVYINVPINSPAPDHLFLLRSPEDAVTLVTECGFEIERTGFFPATNYDLASARQHALTISTCIIAVKPET